MNNLIDLSENVFRIQVVGSEGHGSAFFIKYEGRLYGVTAKHNFENKPTDKAKVFVSNEESCTFSIFNPKVSETEDVMIFEIGNDFPINGIKGLECCVPNESCYGRDVYCLGFPYKVTFDVSIVSKKEIPCIKKGVIGSVVKNFLVDKMLVVGFSGGPVIMDEKVIGVISFGSLTYLYDSEKKQLAEDYNLMSSNEYTQCVNVESVISLINQ